MSCLEGTGWCKSSGRRSMLGKLCVALSKFMFIIGVQIVYQGCVIGARATNEVVLAKNVEGLKGTLPFADPNHPKRFLGKADRLSGTNNGTDTLEDYEDELNTLFRDGKKIGLLLRDAAESSEYGSLLSDGKLVYKMATQSSDLQKMLAWFKRTYGWDVEGLVSGLFDEREKDETTAATSYKRKGEALKELDAGKQSAGNIDDESSVDEPRARREMQGGRGAHGTFFSKRNIKNTGVNPKGHSNSGAVVTREQGDNSPNYFDSIFKETMSFVGRLLDGEESSSEESFHAKNKMGTKEQLEENYVKTEPEEQVSFRSEPSKRGDREFHQGVCALVEVGSFIDEMLTSLLIRKIDLEDKATFGITQLVRNSPRAAPLKVVLKKFGEVLQAIKKTMHVNTSSCFENSSSIMKDIAEGVAGKPDTNKNYVTQASDIVVKVEKSVWAPIKHCETMARGTLGQYYYDVRMNSDKVRVLRVASKALFELGNEVMVIGGGVESESLYRAIGNVHSATATLLDLAAALERVEKLRREPLEIDETNAERLELLSRVTKELAEETLKHWHESEVTGKTETQPKKAGEVVTLWRLGVRGDSEAANKAWLLLKKVFESIVGKFGSKGSTSRLPWSFVYPGLFKAANRFGTDLYEFVQAGYSNDEGGVDDAYFEDLARSTVQELVRISDDLEARGNKCGDADKKYEAERVRLLAFDVASSALELLQLKRTSTAEKSFKMLEYLTDGVHVTFGEPSKIILQEWTTALTEQAGLGAAGNKTINPLDVVGEFFPSLNRKDTSELEESAKKSGGRQSKELDTRDKDLSNKSVFQTSNDLIRVAHVCAFVTKRVGGAATYRLEGATDKANV